MLKVTIVIVLTVLGSCTCPRPKSKKQTYTGRVCSYIEKNESENSRLVAEDKEGETESSDQLVDSPLDFDQITRIRDQCVAKHYVS